jgi:hypothetical protein
MVSRNSREKLMELQGKADKHIITGGASNVPLTVIDTSNRQTEALLT